MPSDKLDVLLTEYKELRNHINENKNHELKLFALVVTALGVIYGIIFANKTYDFILLIPLVFLPLGLRFQYEGHGVTIISRYLSETVEKQIRNTLGKTEDGWKGYQTYYDLNKNKYKGWVYDDISKFLLFILIPMGTSVIYSITIFYTDIIKNFYFPKELYWVPTWGYGILITASIIIVKWLNSRDQKNSESDNMSNNNVTHK